MPRTGESKRQQIVQCYQGWRLFGVTKKVNEIAMIASLKEACGFKKRSELQVWCSVVGCLARGSYCPAPKKGSGRWRWLVCRKDRIFLTTPCSLFFLLMLVLEVKEHWAPGSPLSWFLVSWRGSRVDLRALSALEQSALMISSSCCHAIKKPSC